MVQRVNPIKVIIVGLAPEELQTDVQIVNFKTRSQKIRDKEGKYRI